MQSVTMVNFLRIQRWPSYSTLELHPRCYASGCKKVLITKGDDGEVYTLFRASDYRWHVLRGSKLAWELHKDFVFMSAFYKCQTFAVLGATMFISCNAGIAVFEDGKPTNIISFHTKFRK